MYMLYPICICVFKTIAYLKNKAKGVPLENEISFSYFVFLRFLASVGSPHDNFSAPFRNHFSKA